MFDSAGNFYTVPKTFQYTSGLLYSKEVHKYGQFEITFKANKTKGTVGAFWLFGNDNEEIDVFEVRGSKDNRAQMTLHWQERDPLTRSKQSIYNLDLPQGSFADNFYTMGVIWNEKEILWTFEGDTVKVDAFTQFIRERHVPQNKLNLIMSLEVGTSDGEVDSINFNERIFFKDLRAYTDTIGTDAPEIVRQNSIVKDFNQAFSISLNDVIVKDTYNNYPYGFKLEVITDSTENYKIEDNKIIVNKPLLSQIYIPIFINNGLQNSEVYRVKVENKTIASIKENLSDLLDFVTYKKGELVVNNTSNEALRMRLIEQNGKLISPWQKLDSQNSLSIKVDKLITIIQVEQNGVSLGRTFSTKP